MALPKRRHSSARRDKRRTHWKLSVPSLTRCPNCARLIAPHRVCPHCGSYRGRQAITIPPEQPRQTKR